MRILTFSDWRIQSIDSIFQALEQLDAPVDLILYAGDDVSRFQEDDRNVFSELADETRLGKVLAVLGNDDSPLVREVLKAEGVHDLHQSPMIHGDYVFLGLEGAVEDGPGLILYPEEEIKDHLERQYDGFSGKIPVLVSHVPPNGILDIARRFGQRHIGSVSVREFIEDVSPILTVCGHCHQFGGRAEDGANFGTVINIASHDDPGAKGRYGVVELDGEEIEYAFSTTEEGADHELLQLSQVGSRRIQHFIEAGITELDDISDKNTKALFSVPGSSDWHVDLWLKEAVAIRNDEFIIRDADTFDFLQTDDVVLLDIETDLSQDYIWLVGLYSYQKQEYSRIFEKNDEVKLLNSLIHYLEEHDRPNVVYYGNNRFDETCLKHRMDSHGLDKGIELMDNSYDLGIEINNNLLGRFTRTNLETLSRAMADYQYKYPGMDGFTVGHLFTKYLLDGEEPDWDKLIEYNKDDIYALKTVVDQIRALTESQV